MPKRGDRPAGLDPPRGQFCECGYEWPACKPTAMDNDEHNLYHRAPAVFRRYDTARKALELAVRTRLNRRIVDLELEVEDARWDVKQRDELIDDLKADLVALEERASWS